MIARAPGAVDLLEELAAVAGGLPPVAARGLTLELLDDQLGLLQQVLHVREGSAVLDGEPLDVLGLPRELLVESLADEAVADEELVEVEDARREAQPDARLGQVDLVDGDRFAFEDDGVSELETEAGDGGARLQYDAVPGVDAEAGRRNVEYGQALGERTVDLDAARQGRAEVGGGDALGAEAVA